MTVTVNVWGKRYEVTIEQKSKAVWFAVGDYMGSRLETKGASLGAAIKRWREAAEYRGNG